MPTSWPTKSPVEIHHEVKRARLQAIIDLAPHGHRVGAEAALDEILAIFGPVPREISSAIAEEAWDEQVAAMAQTMINAADAIIAKLATKPVRQAQLDSKAHNKIPR